MVMQFSTAIKNGASMYRSGFRRRLDPDREMAGPGASTGEERIRLAAI
jgi:hypothetical protein